MCQRRNGVLFLGPVASEQSRDLLEHVAQPAPELIVHIRVAHAIEELPPLEAKSDWCIFASFFQTGMPAVPSHPNVNESPCVMSHKVRPVPRYGPRENA